jgi:GNAT superfamily N-acetyltransferase
MIKATLADRVFITEILVKSFDNNASVNYIIKQDWKRRKRIEGLMNYSFNVCYHFGSVYYSEDKKSCALLLIPEQKKTGLRSLFLDIKFVFTSLDLFHLKKTLAREAKIKALRCKGKTIYLWYIGVDLQSQGNGIGTQLLREVLNTPEMKGRTVLLETSTLQSVHWYEKLGFSVYAQLDLGYTLYFMKKEN